MKKTQQMTRNFRHKSNKLFMSYNRFDLICDMQFSDFMRTQSVFDARFSITSENFPPRKKKSINSIMDADNNEFAIYSSVSNDNVQKTRYFFELLLPTVIVNRC